LSATVLVVVGSYVLFVLACGVVGVRLIALAKRTGQLPELLLGVGLTAAVLAMPMLGIAGVGRGTAGDFNSTLGAAAFLLIWTGISFMAAFTWRTFRPQSKWAAILVASISVFEAYVCLSCFHAISSAEPSSPAFDATTRWVLLLRLPVGVMYFWTGLEGFFAYRMARRREALGFADRVVTNRLLLWCWVGWAACGNNLVATVLHAQGKSPTTDPFAALVMSTGGCVGALLLYLAFLPPERYLRFVQRRAEVESASA
jgi:hypothetical protein